MDTENFQTEMPWPVTGDRLFVAATELRYNACVHVPGDKWNAYAVGYKDAADVVVDHIGRTGRGTDTMVYPVTFLYRHFLELRLKEIIDCGQQLLGIPHDLKHIHRIDLLWSTCRQILEQVWPNGGTTELTVVEACIKEFCMVDQQSMSFRYPVTKDGRPTLENTDHIDLFNLREVMGRIGSFLDCASMGISAYLDGQDSCPVEGY